MPKWKIHDRYAKKMGISKKVSKFVNTLIDFPQKIDGYQGTRYMIKPDLSVKSYSTHDSGRTKKAEAEAQIFFLRENFEKDEDYVKAWFLHHALDYIKRVLKLDWISFDDSLNRLEERTKSCEELEEVKKFLRGNRESVTEDLEIKE